ncbi:alpha/beta fold hydrolase [Phaeobacter sp. HF9A]|uniref:alpha/beta hydrolase family protein n=1 Tax=Phaeobacter sp. HF9A TaxID=2721561 RepID=UPI00143018EB|nr:alpha/beta fold hydrolase [Phaeobacter sp. HF9A]NIZ13565.1 alpha/beta fold hydrolase [Phaeobacter sp. HF9A]
MKLKTTILAGLATSALLTGAATAENRIDIQRPDAPELADFGDWPIGVRSMTFTDEDRADVLNSGTEVTTYDRPLPVEIWYPAAEGTEAGTTYETVLRDGETPVTLTGRAARDAAPAEGSFPMILISHGYPGNRYLLSHLGENLASKGYVTVAVDHTDSTYSDKAAFGSTLVNRPLDQRFVIDSMAALDNEIGAITDTSRIGVIGYSMGGYGALIFAGAGLSETAVTRTEPAAYVPPAGLLNQHASGSESHAQLVDPRVKAVIAIGPWGRNRDFWDAEGLAGIKKPLMLMAGSADAVSGYPFLREIFAETTGTDRLLLTFNSAGHNAAAPMPAPANSYTVSEKLGWAPFEHYADAVWDTTRMNNIAQHFATAFFDLHVKGEEAMAPYLDLVETAEDGVWSMTDDVPGPEHNYWTGFAKNTARGLRLEHRAAGE